MAQKKINNRVSKPNTKDKPKRGKKITESYRNWIIFIFLLSSVLCLLSIIIFKPGFFSPDTIDQLGQSQINKYSDWHPASMALLWHYLISITGRVSSMLIFQQAMFWPSILLISLYIFKKTKSRIKSLIPFCISILPPIFLLSGVVWKDVEVAFSLLLALSLSLYINELKGNWSKHLLLLVCLFFVCYANNIRHLVWVAIVPLLIMFFMKFTKKYLLIGSLTLATLLIFFGVGFVTNKVFEVKKTYPETQVMLDDVKELSSVNNVQKSNLSDSSKKYIINVKKNCNDTGVKVSALFRCGTFYDFKNFNSEDHVKMSAFWKRTVLSNPIKYLEFRTKTYLDFIFAPTGLYIIPHPKVYENPFNIIDTNRMTKYVYKYFDFAYRDFRFMFAAYFWILFNFATLIFIFIKKRTSPYFFDLILILTSGLIYVLSFYPSSLSPDFRFYYWTVLSIMFCYFLMIVDASANKLKNK